MTSIPNDQQGERVVALFWVDESYIEIEGKTHIIVGAIYPQLPSEVYLEMVELKGSLGFAP